MKTLIENYRGWEIYFDTDKENFYTSSDDWDRQGTKTSYASTKKFIDDFIKENDVFKPFVIIQKPKYSNYNGSGKKRVVGIRKDNRFIIDNNGIKEQLSEYNENDYMIYNPENDAFIPKLKELDDKYKELKQQEKQLLSEFKVECLKEYKKTIQKP